VVATSSAAELRSTSGEQHAALRSRGHGGRGDDTPGASNKKSSGPVKEISSSASLVTKPSGSNNIKPSASTKVNQASASTKGKWSSKLSPAEFISSKRQELYAKHQINITSNPASSKVRYRNENYSDWLADPNHIAHIELSGPIFGGVAKGCVPCYNNMTTGSITPHADHDDTCPWKRFNFCDPVVEDGVIVVYFFGRDSTSNVTHDDENKKKSSFDVQDNVNSVVEKSAKDKKNEKQKKC